MSAQAAHRRTTATLTPLGRADEPVLAIGIESGILPIDGRWYDVCVVSAYNGVRHNLGLSCGFEVPPAVVKVRQGIAFLGGFF